MLLATRSLFVLGWAVAAAAWYLSNHVVPVDAVRTTDDLRGPLWQRDVFDEEVQRMKKA